MATPAQVQVEAIYDPVTNTLSYVAFDPDSRDAVAIDPVLDYDPVASRVWTEQAEALIGFVRDTGLNLHYVLETHAHADHLSAAQIVKRAFPAALNAVGERITLVQETFARLYDLPRDFPTDGRQFDRLLSDGETLRAGTLDVAVMFTPGHTPACASYLIGDAVFTGDALFMPDMGTGRCDFPQGSAEQLYRSVTERLYTLPDGTRVFVGHDYQPGERALAYQTTVAEQKRANIQLSAATTREQFVAFRTERDRQLGTPRLLYPSVQVNIDAGFLPRANAERQVFLKLPVNDWAGLPGLQRQP